MDKNEKIMAKLAGRKPEQYCMDCSKWLYEEECVPAFKNPFKTIGSIGNKIFGEQQPLACPDCEKQTVSRAGRLMNQWARRYHQKTQGKSVMSGLNKLGNGLKDKK